MFSVGERLLRLHGPDNFKLIRNDQPVPVTGILVAENFFETLGVEPLLGRLFTSEEFVQHAQPVALLSHSFWKRQVASDRSIVGRTINLSNAPVTVIGVLPDTFDFGSVFSPGAKVDLFASYIMDDFRDDGNDLALVGRLKRGVTLTQAQSEADRLFPQLYFEHKHPEYGKGYTGQLTGLKEYVSGRLRRSLIVLWCAVGLILLIVSVNLSNLLIARAAARGREFAMRSALGAGRGRLVRQLLTESLILSGAGALLGLGLAYAVVRYRAHQGSLALPMLSMLPALSKLSTLRKLSKLPKLAMHRRLRCEAMLCWRRRTSVGLCVAEVCAWSMTDSSSLNCERLCDSQ